MDFNRNPFGDQDCAGKHCFPRGGSEGALCYIANYCITNCQGFRVPATDQPPPEMCLT